VQAADGFFEEILPALDRVQEHPRLYPRYLYGTQRAVLNRYPFSVIYRELLSEIQIIAVAHAKRRPGYWDKRL
jgi:plasmid stabilization system protein ParE